MNCQDLINADRIAVSEFVRSVSVSLISFEKELVRLNPEDFLPRYNKVKVELSNKSQEKIEGLVLTVIRSGSTIGLKNYYTVPLATPELEIGKAGVYEVLSFDSFNLPFVDMEVRISTFEDMESRKLSEKYLKRALQISRFIKFSA